MDHKEFLAIQGRKGGIARAKKLSRKRMREIAANARAVKAAKKLAA